MVSEYERVLAEGEYRIVPKTALRLRGKVKELLTGITTNDLNKNKNAFLDRFGKLIALADQQIKEDESYLAIESRYETELLNHLQTYQKFTGTKIEKVPETVMHIIGKEKPTDGIIFPQNIGYLAFKHPSGSMEMSEETHTTLRLENNIPVQGIDFDHQMFLDLGMENAISFTKGCYLGQEVIARAKRVGPMRKLVRILYSAIPERATINGEEVGKITSKCFSPRYGKFLVFAIIRNHKQKAFSVPIAGISPVSGI